MSEEQKPTGDEPKAKKKSKANKPMTNRQTLLVKGIAKGKTITQAAIDAGYSPKNPDRSGWQALKTIREGFVEAAEGLNITPRAFIERYVVPGMEATTTQKWCFLGGVVKAEPEPDHTSQIKYKMLFARLMGAMREEEKVKVEVEHTHRIDLRQVPREVLIAVVRLSAIGGNRRLPGGGGIVPSRAIDVVAG